MGSISLWQVTNLLASNAGIPGNELSDSTVVKAARLPEEDQTVSHHDVRRFLHKKLQETWNQQWTQQPPSKLHSFGKRIRQPLFQANYTKRSSHPLSVVNRPLYSFS